MNSNVRLFLHKSDSESLCLLKFGLISYNYSKTTKVRVRNEELVARNGLLQCNFLKSEDKLQ